MSTKNTVKTRFAPSPTGYLHVGSLRTALYSYLLAKSQGGKFVLRIEDTDQARKVAGATEGLIKILSDFSLEIDEKPVLQSTRLDIYKKYIEQLIKDDKAYYCFCSKDRLDEIRQAQQKAGEQPMYDRHCLSLSKEDVQSKLEAGESYVVRMKIPDNRVIKFDDLVRGKIEFNSSTLDDQVILKSDGFPTYHLAVVVDDHEMEISHVIRGEEWISPTPKHILLYEYFGWDLPEFGHLSLILNPDKSKLSKRQGDVAVEDYLKKGYLKEALLNFIALLGWHPADDTKEIMSLKEMIKEFDVKKIRKSGSMFDIEKLNWMNSQYISKLSAKKLFDRIKNFNLKFIEEKLSIGFSEEYLKNVFALEKERAIVLTDFTSKTAYFFQDNLEYPAEMLVWKKSTPEDTKNNLEKIAEFLTGVEDWSLQNLETSTIKWIKDNDLKNGDVLWPMRVALSGKEKSPSPFEIASVLGKEKTLLRIAHALNK